MPTNRFNGNVKASGKPKNKLGLAVGIEDLMAAGAAMYDALPTKIEIKT